jgi:hypothetical protein
MLSRLTSTLFGTIPARLRTVAGPACWRSRGARIEYRIRADAEEANSKMAIVRGSLAGNAVKLRGTR